MGNMNKFGPDLTFWPLHTCIQCTGWPRENVSIWIMGESVYFFNEQTFYRAIFGNFNLRYFQIKKNQRTIEFNSKNHLVYIVYMYITRCCGIKLTSFLISSQDYDNVLFWGGMEMRGRKIITGPFAKAFN